MALKFYKFFISLFVCAFACFACMAPQMITVKALPSGIPEDCNGNQYCEALKRMYSNGRITKNDADNIWSNASQSDLYKVGAWLGVPGVYLNDFTSSIVSGIRSLKKGMADSQFGSTDPNEYNWEKCFFTGFNCSIKPTNNYSYDDSGVRNYYSGKDVNNNYISGDTSSYSVVNYSNNSINHYVSTVNNNTYNYEFLNTYNFDNYYYDITNNEYHYYYDNREIFNISNNYNYTYVNYVGGQSPVSSKYYFSLPDGSNSFNATPETLKGFILDYHVKNYDIVSDSDRLIGLWHLDQNNKSALYNGSRLLTSPNSISYVGDASTHFDEHIVLNSYKSAFAVPFDPSIKWFDFRLRFTGTINSQTTSSREPFKMSPFLSPSFDVSNPDVLSPLYGSSFLSPSDTYVLSGSDYLGSRLFDFHTPSSLQIGSWVNVGISFDYSKKTFDLYYNGVKAGSNKYLSYFSDVNNYKYVGFAFGGTSKTGGLYEIDEVRTLNYVPFSDNYIPSATPYDSSSAFVLPSSDLNDTVLIQSFNSVNTVQYSGKRKSEPVNGDVYIHVTDELIIDSVQQYDGSDWVEVRASIFSSYSNLWVNLVGKSIKSGFISEAVKPEGGSSGSISEDFLSSKFKEILNSLDSIKETITSLDFTNETIINNNISNLFTVSDNFKNNKIPAFKNEFRNKAGFLTFPFDFSKRLFNAFSSVGSSSSYTGTVSSVVSKYNTGHSISYPDVILFDTVLIPSGSIDLDSFVSSGPFSQIYSFYLIVIRVICYSGLVLMVYKKVMGVITK